MTHFMIPLIFTLFFPRFFFVAAVKFPGNEVRSWCACNVRRSHHVCQILRSPYFIQLLEVSVSMLQDPMRRQACLVAWWISFASTLPSRRFHDLGYCRLLQKP